MSPHCGVERVVILVGRLWQENYRHCSNESQSAMAIGHSTAGLVEDFLCTVRVEVNCWQRLWLCLCMSMCLFLALKGRKARFVLGSCSLHCQQRGTPIWC